MISQKITLRYRNKPAILFATGPSLTEEVVETIRPYKDKFVMFGCNDSYKIVDYLNEHYGCDTKWWRQNGKDFREKYANLSSWTQCRTSAQEYGLKFISGKHLGGFSLSSTLIHFGSNSGYQLMNLAFLMGVSKMILVGYNMQHVKKQTHFFGNHEGGLNNNSPYNKFIKNYKSIQKEIKELVVNCTPDSNLNTFRKNDLKEELNA